MTVHVERFPENPLLRPEQVTPSREGWEVIGTLNPGAIRVGEEILLLVRVAERPPPSNPGELVAPVLDVHSDPPQLLTLRFPRYDPEMVAVDPRFFGYRGQVYLTSMSHLRVARSRDGRHFTFDERPALFPETWYETFGVEDARITELEGRYLVNYTGVCAHGIGTALAETRDFRTFSRFGLIFAPENRDVTIFPERIGGAYFCHHRAVAHHIGGFDMWGAFSPDLRHWGRHERVMDPRPGAWDSSRIGGGSVPIKTERGWLSIYHGADAGNRYCLGALLCDLEQPHRVLARSTEPLMAPEAPYEIAGFFGNVVFTCGTVLQDEDTLLIYYGASDQYVCGAAVSVREILNSLGS